MKSETHLEFYQRWKKLASPYIKWQFDQFKPFVGKRCADIGCGLGNFLPYFAEKGFYLGIDHDMTLVEALTKELPQDGIFSIICIDVTDPTLIKILRSYAIDSILCVNVLEHIEKDRLVVQNIVESLPPGGKLCILVPALPGIFGSLDRLDGHYRRYTKKSLQILWNDLDVDVIRLYYLNLLAVPGWYFKSRVLKVSRQANSNYKIMNIFLPVVAMLESICHPPIGLSLVAVLEKRKISIYDTKFTSDNYSCF